MDSALSNTNDEYGLLGWRLPYVEERDSIVKWYEFEYRVLSDIFLVYSRLICIIIVLFIVSCVVGLKLKDPIVLMFKISSVILFILFVLAANTVPSEYRKNLMKLKTSNFRVLPCTVVSITGSDDSEYYCIVKDCYGNTSTDCFNCSIELFRSFYDRAIPPILLVEVNGLVFAYYEP